jgi:hypothetical protein
MANIGYQGSDINTPLGGLACELRDACQHILKAWEYVQKVGLAGLQAAPYNLSATDAQTLWDAYNHLQTVAAIYYGNAAQPSAWNFHDSLSLVRGGQ